MLNVSRKYGRLLLVPLMSIGLGACQLTPASMDNEILHGVWLSNQDPDALAYSMIEFQSNQDKCEVSVSLSPGQGPDIELFWYKWQMQDNSLTTTLVASSTQLKVGHKQQLKLNAITTAQLSLSEHDSHDAQHNIYYKIEDAKTDQVCSVVKQVFADRVASRQAI